MTLTHCLLMTGFNVVVCLCLPRLLAWISTSSRSPEQSQWLEPEAAQPLIVEALNVKP